MNELLLVILSGIGIGILISILIYIGMQVYSSRHKMKNGGKRRRRRSTGNYKRTSSIVLFNSQKLNDSPNGLEINKPEGYDLDNGSTSNSPNECCNIDDEIPFTEIGTREIKKKKKTVDDYHSYHSTHQSGMDRFFITRKIKALGHFFTKSKNVNNTKAMKYSSFPNSNVSYDVEMNYNMDANLPYRPPYHSTHHGDGGLEEPNKIHANAMEPKLNKTYRNDEKASILLENDNNNNNNNNNNINNNNKNAQNNFRQSTSNPSMNRNTFNPHHYQNKDTNINSNSLRTGKIDYSTNYEDIVNLDVQNNQNIKIKLNDQEISNAINNNQATIELQVPPNNQNQKAINNSTSNTTNNTTNSNTNKLYPKFINFNNINTNTKSNGEKGTEDKTTNNDTNLTIPFSKRMSNVPLIHDTKNTSEGSSKKFMSLPRQSAKSLSWGPSMVFALNDEFSDTQSDISLGSDLDASSLSFNQSNAINSRNSPSLFEDTASFDSSFSATAFDIQCKTQFNTQFNSKYERPEIVSTIVKPKPPKFPPVVPRSSSLANKKKMQILKSMANNENNQNTTPDAINTNTNTNTNTNINENNQTSTTSTTDQSGHINNTNTITSRPITNIDNDPFSSSIPPQNIKDNINNNSPVVHSLNGNRTNDSDLNQNQQQQLQQQQQQLQQQLQQLQQQQIQQQQQQFQQLQQQQQLQFQEQQQLQIQQQLQLQQQNNANINLLSPNSLNINSNSSPFNTATNVLTTLSSNPIIQVQSTEVLPSNSIINNSSIITSSNSVTSISSTSPSTSPTINPLIYIPSTVSMHPMTMNEAQISNITSTNSPIIKTNTHSLPNSPALSITSVASSMNNSIMSNPLNSSEVPMTNLRSNTYPTTNPSINSSLAATTVYGTGIQNKSFSSLTNLSMDNSMAYAADTSSFNADTSSINSGHSILNSQLPHPQNISNNPTLNSLSPSTISNTPLSSVNNGQRSSVISSASKVLLDLLPDSTYSESSYFENSEVSMNNINNNNNNSINNISISNGINEKDNTINDDPFFNQENHDHVLAQINSNNTSNIINTNTTTETNSNNNTNNDNLSIPQNSSSPSKQISIPKPPPHATYPNINNNDFLPANRNLNLDNQQQQQQQQLQQQQQQHRLLNNISDPSKLSFTNGMKNNKLNYIPMKNNIFSSKSLILSAISPIPKNNDYSMDSIEMESNTTLDSNETSSFSSLQPISNNGNNNNNNNIELFSNISGINSNPELASLKSPPLEVFSPSIEPSVYRNNNMTAKSLPVYENNNNQNSNINMYNNKVENNVITNNTIDHQESKAINNFIYNNTTHTGYRNDNNPSDSTTNSNTFKNFSNGNSEKNNENIYPYPSIAIIPSNVNENERQSSQSNIPKIHVESENNEYNFNNQTNEQFENRPIRQYNRRGSNNPFVTEYDSASDISSNITNYDNNPFEDIFHTNS